MLPSPPPLCCLHVRRSFLLCALVARAAASRSVLSRAAGGSLGCCSLVSFSLASSVPSSFLVVLYIGCCVFAAARVAPWWPSGVKWRAC